MGVYRTSEELSQGRHNEDRMRRADSWLERSERAASDRERARTREEETGLDCERFIFLWIAFNSAYGRELIDDGNPKESERFSEFLREVLGQDQKNTIKTILWDTYSGPIRVLLDNRYVYGPFWDCVRDPWKFRHWRGRFDKERKNARDKLANSDVHGVLVAVFDRLYVLRNQIFHGGATFASGWGQEQVRDGSRIMAALVPRILEIMRADIEKNPESAVWGKVAYPRINEAPESG